MSGGVGGAEPQGSPLSRFVWAVGREDTGESDARMGDACAQAEGRRAGEDACAPREMGLNWGGTPPVLCFPFGRADARLISGEKN